MPTSYYIDEPNATDDDAKAIIRVANGNDPTDPS
jgi:hypothetical protein